VATTSLDGEPSLIEFPAAISIKAMGLNEPDFEDLVVSIVQPFIEPAKPDKVVSSLS